MVVDTEFDRVSLLEWECSENAPIGQFLRELTLGRTRRFTCGERWININHIEGGYTFTFEFGEEIK